FVGGEKLLFKLLPVPPGAPLFACARHVGVPVLSEVELGARLLPQPIVGVTGTNGKTTTCELLGAMMRAEGRPVEVAGNVGRPITALEPNERSDARVVCELSSFQLEDIDRFRARVAVLLNITPDHLDRHANLEEYTNAKLRIFENQQTTDVAVVPRSFRSIHGHGRRVEFDHDYELLAEPRIPGPHNRANAAAASLAALAAGVADAAIEHGLSTFGGLPHRLETVGTVAGVRFINDSKATNPEAAEQALRAFPQARVILGGSLKGSSFEKLGLVARETGTRCAYVIGEAAEPIASALAREGVPNVHAGDLAAALARATQDAAEGEVVLLSPACASFDQFTDYEQRGDTFRTLVERL
ncbi:MAG: Mur ligase family protein, partial [Gaiellaceae bacterium]